MQVDNQVTFTYKGTWRTRTKETMREKLFSKGLDKMGMAEGNW